MTNPNSTEGCETECKVTPHASDCAVHNEPALPAGPCDCGAASRVGTEGAPGETGDTSGVRVGAEGQE